MRILRYGVIFVFCVSLLIFSSSLVRDYVTRDTSYPEITSDREVLEISCDYTNEQLLTGLTATDEKDGNLTDQIIAGNMSRFIETGICDITYVVFDSGNQSASLTRRVRFTDYYSPRIHASKPLVFTENNGNGSLMLELLTAEDPLDGDLTDQIVLGSSTVNYSLAGNYYGTFEVANSFGDSRRLQLPVHIIESDNTISIELNAGIVYCQVGETIDSSSFIKKVVNGSGDTLSSRNVSIQSTVNTGQAGIYEIHYTVASGGETGETWLTVVVES